MPSFKDTFDMLTNTKGLIWKVLIILVCIIIFILFRYKRIKDAFVESNEELRNDLKGKIKRFKELEPRKRVIFIGVTGVIVVASIVIICAILAHAFSQRKRPEPYQEITILNERKEDVHPLGVDILDERQVGDYTFFRYKITDNDYTFPVLFKWKKGEPAERISDRACPHFEVAHETVIYLDSTAGDLSHGQLYVVRPDGKAERVLEEELYYFSVENDYIYFIYCYDTVGVGLEGHALHRMDINGDNIITVAYELSGPCLRGSKYDFRIEDGWAIYSNYKVKIDNQADGLEKVVLLESTKDEWIYYTSNKLIKAKPDGTEQMVLDDEDDFQYEIGKIEDGWIYYNKGGDMYKIDINGNYKEKIEY